MNTTMNITKSIRTLLGAAVIAATMSTQQAAAQLWFGGGPARNPVLASKELDEILDSARFDDAQRQLAASMFDDSQIQMFAAKRRFDDEMERVGPRSHDEKSVAVQQQARRVLAQSITESMDGFFQSLAAVARPEQQNDIERERLTAKRRAMRAMVGNSLSDGAIQWDVERAIADANLTPEVRSAAFRVLDNYRQRLDAIFPKLLEAVPDAQQANGRLEMTTGEDGVGRLEVAKGEKSEAAARELRGLVDQLSAAHRDALLALDPTIPSEELATLRLKSIGRIWRRTGRDPDSPAKAIEQLMGKTTNPETRKAIEAVRSAWMARWWNVSMRMTTAESGMRSGMLAFIGAATKDPTTQKAESEFNDIAAERRGIDRDAWKALAGIDPSRSAFYEEQANDAANKTGNRFATRSLPTDGEQPSAVHEVGMVSAISIGGSTDDVAVDFSAIAGIAEGATTAAISISTSADIGDGNSMVFSIDDGGAMGFGDDFGDGMGGGIEFSQAAFDSDSLAGAGLSLAQPASTERVRALAETLGVLPDHAALTQMIDDYQAKCHALKNLYFSRLRAAVPGVAMAVEPSMQEAPVDQIRTGIGIVDAHIALLAIEDDAMLDGIAALSGADEALTQAVRAERARERIQSLHYPSMPGMDWPAAPFVTLDLAGCVRTAGLVDANRLAAMQAWMAWSGSALAIQEQLRAEARSTAAEEIEVMRTQWRRPQQAVASSVTGTEALAVGMSSADKRAQELQEKRARRYHVQNEQAIAGRDAIDAALPSDARATFHDAWLRAAAPKAYRDGRDAMTTLDTARGLPSVTDAQRTQIDALRGEQAAYHRELCDRLAGLLMAESVGPTASTGGSKKAKEPRTSMEDTRFERSELNARSLRRLKSILTDEQVRAIPALVKTAAKQGQEGAVGINSAGLSPAPTPAAPVQK